MRVNSEDYLSSYKVSEYFCKENIKNPFFLCIGTDKCSGDSLGPFVGNILERYNLECFGSIDYPCHARNLEKYLDYIPKDRTLIAIDASLGKESSVGFIECKQKPLHPGSGVERALRPVGDYSIQGYVNISGYKPFFVLSSTRLSLVIRLSYVIAEGIINAFTDTKEYIAVTKEFYKRKDA